MLFLGALLIASPFGFAQGNETRPNILWIVSEDNTASFIGAYGNAQANTPNIDSLAKRSILYENAYCTAPVCAPSRATLITGMYPVSLGVENMRSEFALPAFVQFFPKYLRAAGYYTSNNAKKGYNTVDQPEAWDESSNKATYKNRKAGQPFFAVFNIETSHESSIFPGGTKIRAFWSDKKNDSMEHPAQPPLQHDPEKIRIPAYHPVTREVKEDWARYYDKVSEMDAKVGALLRELEEAGLADNTIVFYYSDNGGVLGRSKRFVFENGLHVPLIVHMPERYKNYAAHHPGTRATELVDFTDFPATVLSLAGIAPPEYFQGRAFLGKFKTTKERTFSFGFRGRMDESFDLVRSIRKGRYRYVKNFMPHRPYGQYVSYLWLANNVRSWEQAYKNGTLNEVQSRFFLPKPQEELYDVITDPDNIHNLAQKKEFSGTLKAMREETYRLLIEINDVGLVPEPEAELISQTTTLYDYARSGKYDVRNVLQTAIHASSGGKEQLPFLLSKTSDHNPVIRYWAATGLLRLGGQAKAAIPRLQQLLQDDRTYIATVAAEALYRLGYKQPALAQLSKAIKNTNDITRLQALNALQLADIKELKEITETLQTIANGDTEYDSNAAQYLLKKMAAGIK